MSEYQYYEFLAVDRPLTGEEVEQVRAMSTRAQITATSFVNEYHWGDFRGDPTRLVERLYDAHLYYANWGSRRLALRLPAAALEAETAAPYALDECLSVWSRGTYTLLDFEIGAEEFSEWEDVPSCTLSSFIGLRAELAAGDLRALYLAWLAALRVWELAEDDEEEYACTVEPPVPAGLGALTGPQRALADFLYVDQDLLAVAAQRSAPAPRETAADRAALAAYIAALPDAEKDALLLDAALGTAPGPGPQLLARYRAAHPLGQPEAEGGRRSAAELLDAAHLHRVERTRRGAAGRAAAQPVTADSGG